MTALNPYQQWWHYSELPSTNDQAKRLAADHFLSDGAVVLADEQTQGRGQQHTTWYSKKGESLTFSLVYFPLELKATHQFWLNMAIANGLADGLRSRLPDPGNELAIKWPNDILVRGRKLGGILIENVLEGSYLQRVIAGIGLNLNQKAFRKALPDAIALHQVTGETYDPVAIAEELVMQVHQQYERLRQGQWAAIREQYYRCLYRFQQWHDFYDARGRQFRGWIRGVSEQGELLLLDKHQKEHAFSLKEITFQAD